MFSELNASQYNYKVDFSKAEFEDILSKIILCYELMLKDKVSLVNDENKIRDILLINYLKNNAIRAKFGLTSYIFDREVPEDFVAGRTDIKVQMHNTFIDSNAYYIIECKRLNAKNQAGQTGLNAEYIKNGIHRFISKTYTTYNNTNGMIGFIIEKIDINNNINHINTLLSNSFKETNTIELIKKQKLTRDFNYSYCSTHKIGKSQMIIYHLMFDFSENIKKIK